MGRRPKIDLTTDTEVYRLAYPPSEADYAAGLLEGRPNPAQAVFEALDPRIPIHCLVAGFGTGKSLVGSRKGLRAMLANPGSNGMVIAPTYRHADIILERMVMSLEMARQRYGYSLIRRVKRTRGESLIELVNGSSAELFTGQNRTSWFGADKTWILLDEWEWMDDCETVLDSAIHRLREGSIPGIRRVNHRNLFVTSTAQTSSGPLRHMIDRARVEEQKAKDTPGYIPEVATIVAPSRVAIGYGLTADMIRTWRANMGDERAYRRAIECDLSPPPEVVYQDVVSDANLVPWTFQPSCMTYIYFDWGINNAAWLMGQWSPQHNALIIFREWAPAPAPAGMGEAKQSALEALKEYGMLAPNGRLKNPQTLRCVGDPTANPGAGYKPSETDMAALDGASIIKSMGWHYTAPLQPWQRSKHIQVSLLRQLLGGKPPRVYFSKQLAAESVKITRTSYTSKGIWEGLTSGLRYRKDNHGLISEKIDKSTGFDHLHDALCYGTILLFANEAADLLRREQQMLGG